MSFVADNKDDLDNLETGRIVALIAGYLGGQLSEDEQRELDNWVALDDANMLLFEELTDRNQLMNDVEEFGKIGVDKRLRKIKSKLKFTDRSRLHYLVADWKTYVAAASIVIAFGVIAIFLQRSDVRPTSPLVILHKKQDVAPGGSKAKLILSNGKEIVLTGLKDGMVDEAGAVKEKEELIFNADKNASSSLQNTVTTPNGGVYAIRFEDGTKLWLNANSFVRFPEKFKDDVREVEIGGEAYFEVAKNKLRPFKVKVNDAMIEVVGTHFNVNAYQDEGLIRTSLLEGSIKMRMGSREVVLKENEEAVIQDNLMRASKIRNVDAVIAWKRGLFEFSDASIEIVMRQLARWYDVQIRYEGAVPKILTTGKAPRNTSLATLLQILSLSGVHYKIEGKVLTILP